MRKFDFFKTATRKQGVRTFQNPRERRMAALQIYHDRLMGARVEELSKTYKLSRPTIRKLILLATNDDIVKRLEQKILESVVPKAIEVYTKKLEEGSEFVAKDVLANFAKIADRNVKRDEIERKNSGDDEDSLEFLMRIKGKRSSMPMLEKQNEEVIDGTVIESGELSAASGEVSGNDFTAAVETSVTEAVRGSLQGVGLESEGAPEISRTNRKTDALPTLIRRENKGNFVSIRDILRESLENE